MTTGNTTMTSDKAKQSGQEAKDSAQQMGQQTRQAWNDVQQDPSPTGIQATLENLPAPVYLWATIGSIGLSAVLRLLGRKDFATFVGLWPPTIVALALMNKQIRPSREM